MKFSWHIVAYGSAALLLAGAVVAYEGAKRDQIRSEATQQAQAAVQKQLSQQIADLQKQIADREVTYQADMKALQGRLSQAATPQQIATLVSQVMGLKTPIQITTPQASSTNPSPQPVAQVSLSDAPQVKAYVNECETCKLTLPKLQADLADRVKQMTLAEKEMESLKTQRDAAVSASKGGSWLRRLGKGMKVVTCATAGGAAGGAIGKDAKAAGIGAGAGAVVCSLF